jgi:Fe2+ transport system protein FeoA
MLAESKAGQASSGGAVSLSDCLSGQALEVLDLAPKLSCAQRLRELGIIEGAQIKLLRRSDPFVVLAMECRIAIDLTAARRIKVRLRERASGSLR